MEGEGGEKLTPKGILEMYSTVHMNDVSVAIMNHPLGHFLEERRSSEGPSKTTMTGIGNYKGKWIISDDDYPVFLNYLHDYLFVKKNRALGLAEQPRVDTHKPLLIDLDFKYPENRSTAGHLFTEEQIEKFCEVLQRGISYFFDVNEYPVIRYFVLLRSSAYPTKGTKEQPGYTKDGIHIESPDFTLSNDKWNVLRQWILRDGAIHRIFGSTGYLNTEADIFDPSMGRRQGWMFYGESKPSISPYQLEFVKRYEPETDEWSDDTVNEEGESTYSSRELMQLLSIRYKVEDECGDVLPERKQEFDGLLNIARRRDASARSPMMAPQEAGAATNQLTTLDPLPSTVQALLTNLPYTDETRSLVGRLVMECLSEERSTDHDNWMRVGWCLHNLEPSEEMFDLWIEFTKKSPKWDHHRHMEYPKLRREWFHGMRKEGDGPRLTLRSLHKWAREDNREAYERIMNEDILEYIINKVRDNTHYHVAQLMERMFQTTYVASIGQRTTEWFLYDEILNMWKHLNQGIDLKRKICFDVAGKIDAACGRIRDQMKVALTGGNQSELDRLNSKMEELHKLQAKLYNVGFIDSVMKMAAIFFAEEDFTKKLNINPYLLGFANGILELRYKESPTAAPRTLFRQGKPEDYVSFLAGRCEAELDPIVYKEYDENDPYIAEIYDFFDKLFPSRELRDYVLKLLASTLEGANPEQCYYIFTGRGSNGKSKLMDLMTYVLGDYITSIQSTVLTRKRPDSGAANPDVIVTKCKRFIYMQEPDAKEPINTSRMKQFSGEDLVEARALFGDQEKFKIMGKLFMMCNDLPPIYSMDNGTWRRIRVVPFVSTFRSPEHADWKTGKPHIYLKDENLGLKLKEWRQSFMSLLVHIYETQYLKTGLHPEPAVILQESNKYKADYDVFARFCHERIRREDGNRVDFKEINRIFKRWCQENGIKKGLNESELWNRVLDSSDIGKFDERKKILIHIRLFSTDEEVEFYDNENSDTEPV